MGKYLHGACRRVHHWHNHWHDGKIHSISLAPFLTGVQLVIAWFAGARFDIAFDQFKEQMGQLLGIGKAINASTESGHSEL